MDTANAPSTFIADIAEGTQVEPGRPHHIKVLSAPDVRVVVLTFEAGHVMKEHQSPKALLLQPMSGRVRITADGHAYEMAPGSLLRLDAGLPHMVEAIDECRLMLTMIG